MRAAESLSAAVGILAACAVMAVPRASFYRRRKPCCNARAPRSAPSHALSLDERRIVLEVLHSAEFIDQAPRGVWATLLDRAIHLCSVSTMYRILRAQGEVGERRAQRVHPVYRKPELLATGRNQVWSWDITKLRGPAKWTYFHLYVVLDIFSRYVVGWMVADHESAILAKRLLEETCAKQAIQPGHLIIHQDRGTAMTSKTVTQMYADLSIEPSYSRPHVSDDNPYSEAQFKTLKYRPGFPNRFGSIEDAIAHCRSFFPWYNTEHRHSGIAYFTPEAVHYGDAERLQRERHAALATAYAAHPERFVNGPPRAPELPRETWINPPVPRPSTPVTPVPPQPFLKAPQEQLPDREGRLRKNEAPGCPRFNVGDQGRPVASPLEALPLGSPLPAAGAGPRPITLPAPFTVAAH